MNAAQGLVIPNAGLEWKPGDSQAVKGRSNEL
jgi:hypothetical protein